MPEDLIGGLIGGEIGEGIRGAYFRRKHRRAVSGRSVRVRTRAHPSGAPDWRYWRGALVRRGGRVRWRPWLRRWRSFDLSGPVLVGTRTQRSYFWGDRHLLDLHGVDRCDHLAASIESGQIIESLLRPV